MLHADDLQAVSVDEALIDVTNTVNQLRGQSGAHDPEKDYAEQIRAEVRKATGCESKRCFFYQLYKLAWLT